MDDNIILMKTRQKLLLIKLKSRNYEIIQSLKIEDGQILKLTNEKILIFSTDKINIIKYKNKYFMLEKKIILKSIKNFNMNCGTLAINENEIAILNEEKGFFGNKRYFSFYDLEKDKKIKSFEFDSLSTVKYDLLDDKALILGNKKKIFLIDLITHSKAIEYTLFYDNDIRSILCLDKIQIIVGQENYIYHLYLDKGNNKFCLKGTFNISLSNLYKYPKSRLLVAPFFEKKTLYLYG